MLLGYGEDALTLWIVSEHLSAFLRVLGDQTPAADATVLYRPSFGRRGTGPGERFSAQFGEFDAIIGTSAGVYLIETKWSSSTEARGHSLVLSAAQVRRHAVMRCYIEERRAHGNGDWAAFAARSTIEARLASYRVGVAKPGRRTTRNLEAVLGLLDRFSGPVQDVLLFARAENDLARSTYSSPPGEVSADSFILVGVDCRSALSGGFLPLGRPGAEPRMWVTRPGLSAW